MENGGTFLASPLETFTSRHGFEVAELAREDVFVFESHVDHADLTAAPMDVRATGYDSQMKFSRPSRAEPFAGQAILDSRNPWVVSRVTPPRG